MCHGRSTRVLRPSLIYQSSPMRSDVGAPLCQLQSISTARQERTNDFSLSAAMGTRWQSQVCGKLTSGRVATSREPIASSTVAANATIAPIHNRMPLVLEPEDWSVWLGEIPGDPASLLRPPADDVLVVRPVSRRS
jgi:putative SOS response-associated peptidase YedK